VTYNFRFQTRITSHSIDPVRPLQGVGYSFSYKAWFGPLYISLFLMAARVAGNRLSGSLSKRVWAMERGKTEVGNGLDPVVGERGSYFPLVYGGHGVRIRVLNSGRAAYIIPPWA